jgi:hypothetical protein
MPRGPKGEKRPADVIGNAVHVMRIATGEIEDNPSKAPKRAKGGKIGGHSGRSIFQMNSRPKQRALPRMPAGRNPSLSPPAARQRHP